MATGLTDFLMRYAGRPMVWGRDDCSLLLADWWLENHGVDPASHLRGTYATEKEKKLVVFRSGGLIFMVAKIARRAGAKRTDHPRDGSFALIRHNGQVISAIRSGDFWAVRSENGIAFTRDAEMVRAWEI